MRKWLGLAVLGLPTLLLALDLSVLYLALPRINAELRPSSTQLLWITDIYGFMIAGFLITMGGLGDRIGRRRLLLIGAAAFAAASVMAAYSTSAEMLIVARALLGIAGATQMPSTLALISSMFPDDKQRGMAVAAWVATWTAGSGLGPVVGGVLLEWFWWGSVFLLSVPIMGLLLVLGPMLLPEFRDRSAGRLDLTSVALALVCTLSVVYGLKELATSGFATPPLLVMLAGLVFGVLFVRRQRGMRDPLLDLRLFRSRRFSVAVVVMVLSLVTFGGTELFVTQYMQVVAGLRALNAALWLLPVAVAGAVTSLLAPLFRRWMSPGAVLGMGLAFAGLGYALLTLISGDSGPLLPVIGLAVVSAAFGPLVTVNTDLIVGSSPVEKAGSASAISETSTELGVSLGVAILGTVWTSVNLSRVEDGVPAHEAFTAGLNAVTGVSALVAVVLAILAVTLLRHRRAR